MNPLTRMSLVVSGIVFVAALAGIAYYAGRQTRPDNPALQTSVTGAPLPTETPEPVASPSATPTTTSKPTTTPTPATRLP